MGIFSSAFGLMLFYMCLTRLGFGEVSFLVPNRFEYGYGLTPEIVRLAQQRDGRVVLLVRRERERRQAQGNAGWAERDGTRMMGRRI
jgi:hypothetical protein